MAFSWLHPDIGVRLAQYLSVKQFLEMKTSLFLRGQGMADSVFEEKTRNQTLQLPRFLDTVIYL
jgi:hypothetical protein